MFVLGLFRKMLPYLIGTEFLWLSIIKTLTTLLKTEAELSTNVLVTQNPHKYLNKNYLFVVHHIPFVPSVTSTSAVIP